MAKCLADKTLSNRAEELEGILRASAGRRRLECKMLIKGWPLVKIYCLLCDKSSLGVNLLDLVTTLAKAY